MTRAPLLAALALMTGAMALIPLGDSAGKALTDGMGVGSGFVAWSRFALASVLLFAALNAPGLRAEGLGLLLDWRICLRGALLAACVWAILTALATEPLARVFGAFFVGPILSAALAVLLLGERVSRAQAACLVLGFAGVLVVVRPGWELTPGMGFAVLAGMFYGGFLTASRWLAGRARPLALLFSQFAIGALLLAPAGLAQLPPPGGLPLVALIIGSAVSSLTGNLLLILAYRRAEAARLAPLVYVQLVAATGFGIAFFGDWPDIWVLVGMALLILSGVAGFLLAPRAR
jgi:drug/metabolite transporter (DMT)-like permease